VGSMRAWLSKVVRSSCFRWVEVCVLGRCFVRLGYCVSKVFVFVECSRGNLDVCGRVNDDVAIE